MSCMLNSCTLYVVADVLCCVILFLYYMMSMLYVPVAFPLKQMNTI